MEKQLEKQTEEENWVFPLWGQPWHSTAVVKGRCHPAREQERAGSGTKVAGDDSPCEQDARPGFGRGRAAEGPSVSPAPLHRGEGPWDKRRLFGASGGMNGVLKATTSGSRLVFSPHH